MNILHMKYAYEVARQGSLSKAAERLLVAVPNLSRCIKELESDLGVALFERTTKGMFLTPQGEEFMAYAQGILKQIDQLEGLYKGHSVRKQKFSLSVPRASYIADAFAEFSKKLSADAAELFYKETNSRRTILNLTEHDYRLGIIRYAEPYDVYFKTMLEEKKLRYETVTEFTYQLVMSREHPLAHQETITFDDLRKYIEVAHADPYVPSLPLAKVVKEELSDTIDRRIFVFERASQFELLCRNPQTFMWVSPIPQSLLDRYDLVQKPCAQNNRRYRDVLIYRENYRLTDLDHQFITALCESRRKYLR